MGGLVVRYLLRLTVSHKVAEHLDGIERSTSTLGMELDAPHRLARIISRLDALDRGIVAVDEEGLPACREGLLKFQGVLMILAAKTMSADNIPTAG
jgi:hypothetical protein